MTRDEARTQHVANALAGATGLAYLWLKYFVKNPDPYSSAGSPWEPYAHNAHVLVSPFLIFAVGLIWAGHVWYKYSRPRQRRRKTGVLIAALFAPMAVSAYLIQITVDESWRRAWAVIHVATSLAWLLGYVAHLVTRPAK